MRRTRTRLGAAATLLVFLGVGSLIAVRSLHASDKQRPRAHDGEAAPAHRSSSDATKIPLSRLAGQTVMSAFTGTSPGQSFLSRIRRGEVGSVILFGENIRSPRRVAVLVRLLQRAAKGGRNPPLLIAVDQEGGIVKRLPNGPPTLSAKAMGDLNDVRYSRREGERTGLYLRALGINVDLAPVADVPDSASSFLASRAFGTDPRVVARMAAAFADGLQAMRVAATVKHFPGLGTARANTDAHLVVVGTPHRELMGRLLPFRRAIAAGVRLVMISNAVYPALDRRTPAVFSRAIVTDLLRGRLGFKGVAITDTMDAPAPSARREAAARAIESGVDILLYANEQSSRAGFARLLAASREQPELRARLRQAYARVLTLKRWLANRPTGRR